uniref:Ubiquitin-like protease family profile domain-containing protein n=1 Tax=Cyclopterus lumpus TaxID=8103 RepID=A0A8C3AGR0_CYCLU
MHHNCRSSPRTCYLTPPPIGNHVFTLSVVKLSHFPPPPLKGGITVTMEDLRCLDTGHFLNDVIIDFYLKYLLLNASAAVAERTHIFSSFFYKQLTRRDNASEGRQRRHHRVKTWTRHVDIFKKDFLFVPVNQEAHWYLVLICFPGLDEPTSETWSGPNGKWQEPEVAEGSESPKDNSETPPTLNHGDRSDTETGSFDQTMPDDGSSLQLSCVSGGQLFITARSKPSRRKLCARGEQSNMTCVRPLRYLQSEWEVRRGSSRDFSLDQMQSSHCKVPLQDNSSDCGLYLLQYVESFLKDPVVHFDLPLHLQQWFPRQQVRRKRDQVRDLTDEADSAD